METIHPAFIVFMCTESAPRVRGLVERQWISLDVGNFARLHPGSEKLHFQRANPAGDLYLIGDDLSSHKSPPIMAWLADRPRVHQVLIPVGARWLHLQEAWWRLFRREAGAGQSFIDAGEIDRATRVATAQLNRRAKPWVWNRPPRPPRHRRRVFVYSL